MTLFALRIALLVAFGGITTLGFANLSEDGSTLTIDVGQLAVFLHDHALGAGAATAATWAAMWWRAKKSGGMT